jgi:hypothetical protein
MRKIAERNAVGPSIIYIYIYIYIYRNTHQTLYFPISRYKVEQCPNSIYFSKYAIFQKLLMIK